VFCVHFLHFFVCAFFFLHFLWVAYSTKTAWCTPCTCTPATYIERLYAGEQTYTYSRTLSRAEWPFGQPRVSCGCARECRGIVKEAREISGSRTTARRTRDMISLCMRDRILLVKAQAQWKMGDIEALVRTRLVCEIGSCLTKPQKLVAPQSGQCCTN
jgi:hypothetical protein